MEIILSTLLLVLINESPIAEFGIDRGLRQGDPLSPLFYN